MKRTSAALKLLARETLSGRYGTPVAALMIMGLCSILPAMLITSIMDTTTTVGIITSQILVYAVSLIVSVVGAGYSKLMLNMGRGEPFAVKDLFYGFTHNPDRFIIVHLILLAVQFVICLPLDLPGYTAAGTADTSVLAMTLLSSLLGSLVSIVLGLFFGLADFLLLDNPDMGAMESMKESLKLMKGNKGRLFYINLSFLPLYFLSIISCYIGLLWVTPYVRATLAFFYMDVTGELDDTKKEPFDDTDNQSYGPY